MHPDLLLNDTKLTEVNNHKLLGLTQLVTTCLGPLI